MNMLVKSCIVASSIFLVTQNAQANCWNLADAECLAPKVLQRYYDKDNDPENKGKNHPDYYKEWSPTQGMVTTIGYSFFFKFKFDDEAIRIIRSNDLFGLEVEVVLEGSDRNKIQIKGFGASTEPNLYLANIGLDTEASDANDKRTIGLHFLNPQNLEAGIDYKFIIQTNKKLADLDISIRPQIQITFDVPNYNNLVAILSLKGWLMSQIADLHEQIGQYKYFVLETDGFVRFSPDSKRSVKWNNHVDSFVVQGDGPVHGPWPFIGPIQNPISDSEGRINVSIGGGSNYIYPPYQSYTPGEDPNAPTADIHISHLRIGWSKHHLHDKLEIALQPGVSKRIHIEGRAKNDMDNGNFTYVRYEYCVVGDKKKFLLFCLSN